MTGLVSVILTTHYRNDSLRCAIESARDQSLSPAEIIVVDDSGEAFAEPVAEEYDVTYIPHPENRGQIPAWNTGVEAASGEYVQLLDDDDQLRPEKFERQVGLLEESDDAGVAYAGVRMPDGREVSPAPEGRTEPLKCALQIYFPGGRTSSLLIRREILADVMPLAPREAATDVGLKIELARRTGFDYVDEILTDIGGTDSRQSSSVAFANTVADILQEYAHLYDEFPGEVRAGARSFMNEVRANELMAHAFWSPAATYSYLKAAYYDGGPRFRTNRRIVLFVAALASVFGQPGITVASKVRERFS